MPMREKWSRIGVQDAQVDRTYGVDDGQEARSAALPSPHAIERVGVELGRTVMGVFSTQLKKNKK